jgi:glycerol-3-phosphate dehydrogenase (NAD(P)+)
MRAINVGIIGAGAFGTSLAICLADRCTVSLFSFFDDHVRSLKNTRYNDFLPGFSIPDIVEIGTFSEICGSNLDYVLWALPVKPSVEILGNLSKSIDGITVVICSKGMIQDARFLTDEFDNFLPSSSVGCLSGPNFAAELAGLKCSASNVAFADINVARTCAADLSNQYFKLIPIDDIIGIQLCGAAKNVVAIACGIALGLNLGQNAHAALLSFAMYEIRNLGLKLGAREDTFCGLCGFGDLVLTASSLNSRNTELGRKIAEGHEPLNIVSSSSIVYEGYEASSQIFKLAQRNGIGMPICDAVYSILHKNESPKSILNVFG